MTDFYYNIMYSYGLFSNKHNGVAAINTICIKSHIGDPEIYLLGHSIASGTDRIEMDHKLLYLSNARIKGYNLAQGMYVYPSCYPV